MTIDELARKTGMTVRNIRAHQSRGLLPPPDVRGRTGYYNDDHASRIELIREMQGDGLNLEAIRRFLEGVGGSSAEFLDFSRAARAAFEDEEPEIIDARELLERWQGDEKSAQSLLDRAEELGLVRALGDGDGRYELMSPRLAQAGAELAGLGVSPDIALEILAKMRRHAMGVSRAFVALFVDSIWTPFEEAGMPEEDWPKVQESLERLRPIASESLLAIFGLTMAEETDRALGRALARRGGGQRDGKKRRSRRG
jgi:DNA-binding transcriptional MerR regulator